MINFTFSFLVINLIFDKNKKATQLYELLFTLDEILLLDLLSYEEFFDDCAPCCLCTDEVHALL